MLALHHKEKYQSERWLTGGPWGTFAQLLEALEAATIRSGVLVDAVLTEESIFIGFKNSCREADNGLQSRGKSGGESGMMTVDIAKTCSVFGG